MEVDIPGSIKKTYSMDEECYNWRMDQGMKAISTRTSSKEMAEWCTPMETTMMGSSWIMQGMALGLILEKMAKSMSGSGSTIRCEVMECSLGLMGQLMMGNIWMIGNLDMVSLDGKMGECMKVIGLMEKGMAGGLSIKNRLLLRSKKDFEIMDN
mmetsp:Transcript_15130/g.7355  ORF Transcript_15130/g.7355 Transcript_15130/m.7355 type:complete len:154 (+) Transcript_15130:92-553(+)